MAAMPVAVDLSRLPAPNVVEELNFETILAAISAHMLELDPDFPVLDQADPAVKVMQVAAYREMLLRQRVNSAAKSVMLAFAKGADLRQLGALFGIEIRVLDPGDPDNGVAPTYEPEADLRARIANAPEAYSVAGPEGAYRALAIEASTDVLDVDVYSPSPAVVEITILSREGDGTPSPELIALVSAAVSAKSDRPIGDRVTVQAPGKTDYAIAGTLYLDPGPDAAVVLAQANAQVAAYRDACHRLGRRVALSGIVAAAHVPGVQRVVLTSPVADITPGHNAAAWCTSIALAWAAA